MLKQIKELGKDSVVYGLGSTVSQFLSLFLVPYYSKALSPTEYGIVAIIGLFSQFTTPILAMGLDNALFRYFSLSETEEEKKIWLTTSFFMKMSFTIVFIIILYFGYPLLDKYLFENKLTHDLFLLALGLVFFSSIGTIAEVVIRSQRKPRILVTVQLIVLVISLSLSIYWVLILRWGVFGALSATLVGRTISAILLSIYLKRYIDFKCFSISKGRILLGYGLPYVPHKIQGQIMQLFSLFIINQQMGIAMAGIYSVVNKFVKPIWLIVGSIQKAWVPYRFHLHKTEDDPRPIFRSISGNYWMVLIFMWSVACLIFPSVFRLLVNERYHSGISYFPFLAFIAISQAFYFTVNTGIELRQSQKILPVATFFGMITVVGVSLTTVQYIAPYGPIMAQSLSFLVIAAITWVYARKVMVISYPFAMVLMFLTTNMILVTVNYLQFNILSAAVSMSVVLVFYLILALKFNRKSAGEAVQLVKRLTIRFTSG